MAVLTIVLAATAAGALNAEEWCDKGDDYFERGENESSTECYDKALEIDPEHAYAWLKKGEVAIAVYEYEEAHDYLLKASELDPHSDRAGLLDDFAVTVMEYHDRKAEKGYPALKITPPEAEQLFIRAFTNYRTYQREVRIEVIGLLDRVLEFDPKLSDPAYAEVWFKKADLLFEEGEYEEALECCLNIIKLKPDYYDAYYLQWFSLYELGREAEAEACFDHIKEIDPDYAYELNRKIYFRYGYTNNVDSEIEIKCYGKYLEVDPDKPDIWYTKGHIERKLGHYEDALHSFGEAERYFDKPYYRTLGNYWVKYETALVYAALGEKTKMLEKLREAITMNPAFHGFLEKDPDLEDYREDRDFRKMLEEVKPTEEELILEEYEGLAYSGIQYGFLSYKGINYDIEKGLICYELIFETYPFSIEISRYHNDAIDTLNRLGRYEEALEYSDRLVEAAAEIDPAYADYFDASKIPILIEVEKYEEAIEKMDRLPVEYYEHRQMPWIRSFALARLGKFEDAIDHIRTMKHTYSLSSTYYAEAQVHAIRGNRTEMLESLANSIYEDYGNKYNAQTDPAFEPYWDDPDFREVVTSSWFD